MKSHQIASTEAENAGSLWRINLWTQKETIKSNERKCQGLDEAMKHEMEKKDRVVAQF